MSPIYLLWDSSCKLIIYCGTHPPELIKYRPISHREHGNRLVVWRGMGGKLSFLLREVKIFILQKELVTVVKTLL